MWEADPTILKRTYGGDAIEAFMVGEAILVRLLRELIGMHPNVEPMGDGVTSEKCDRVS
jgi:hypothetical protein